MYKVVQAIAKYGEDKQQEQEEQGNSEKETMKMR